MEREQQLDIIAELEKPVGDRDKIMITSTAVTVLEVCIERNMSVSQTHEFLAELAGQTLDELPIDPRQKMLFFARVRRAFPHAYQYMLNLAAAHQGKT